MWPEEYIELKHIQDLLLCGICYDFMDTPVITSCSHSYCSLCIRKYLHYKTQCPACFSETFEKDLRKNKVLDEIIKYFQLIKDKLKRTLEIYIQFSNNNQNGDKSSENRFSDEYNNATDIQNVISYTSSNNKLQNSIFDHVYNTPTKKNGVPASKSFSTSDIAMKTVVSPSTSYLLVKQTSSPSPSTSSKTRIPLMFTPKSKKRIVPTNAMEDVKTVVCPVCKVVISEMHINKHLDDCLKRETTKERRPPIISTRKPLPKLVFSLMKDAVIKKKLKEFGLSVQGDRKAMENRLQRYTILYNAECDKSMPRSAAELVKQCEEEENVEKKINKTSILNKLQVTRNTEENVIEAERKKYLNANKGSFENLIRNMKRTKAVDSSPKKASINHNLLENEKENTCDNVRPHSFEHKKLIKETIVEAEINESINESSDESYIVPSTPTGSGYDKVNCYFTIQDSDSETSLKVDNAEKNDSKKMDSDEDNNVSSEKGNVNGNINSSCLGKESENNLETSYSLVNFENFAKQNLENVEDETVEKLDEMSDNSSCCNSRSNRSFRKRSREPSSQLSNSVNKKVKNSTNDFTVNEDEEKDEESSFLDSLLEEEKDSIFLKSLLEGVSEETVPENKSRSRKRLPRNQSTKSNDSNLTTRRTSRRNPKK
ncbi:E3 ubiquitin-protein ligase RAD18-like [Ceratina calcarata]|uniref:RING-type E3 ubiquitin transferase n=1 Tax=Ceratina calcarata TaxID=156304 RepID=A0AAJ7JA04_9HYME|nr:E3 ubiquitin-protein ligase RAD18-like [Ceratina calcarata]